eukprot:9652803-Ditylum_brightwellii.AAC.1
MDVLLESAFHRDVSYFAAIDEWRVGSALTERLLSTEHTPLLANMLVFAGFFGQHTEEYLDGEMVTADEWFAAGTVAADVKSNAARLTE